MRSIKQIICSIFGWTCSDDEEIDGFANHDELDFSSLDLRNPPDRARGTRSETGPSELKLLMRRSTKARLVRAEYQVEQ